MNSYRTDHKMLVRLVDEDRVKGTERDAFEDMLERLEGGIQINLSKAQREWVERRYLQLHLDSEEPAQNLVSSGKVKPSTKPQAPLAFETMPKPLKPPGRI